MTTSNKQQLGQFYTTNYQFILQGLLDYIPTSGTVIEPFVGQGDLLNVVNQQQLNVIAYDIEPKILPLFNETH